MFQHFGLVAPTIDVQADRNDVKRSKSLRNPAPEQEWIERPASPNKLPSFPFRTDFTTFHHVSPLSAVDPPPRCVMFQPLRHTNTQRSRTMEHNHSNSRSEKRCTGKSPARKARMGHLSNSGFSSQFNHVWSAESLRNDNSNDSNNNNHQGNTRMSATHGTNSWTARPFGQTDASSSSQLFGRSSNRTGANASSMLGGVSSSGEGNSVESIWGPGSF